MIRNLIWDFDGMLFDTYPHMTEAMRRALADFGAQADYEAIFRPIKLSVREACVAILPQTETDEGLYRQVMERYQFWEAPGNPPHAGPYPGVPALLRAVCACGRRNLVYSHRGLTLYDYLDENGLRDCFSGFVTEDMHFPHKPAPDAILYLLRNGGLEPEETLMLGDRAIDVESGRNAGVHTCLFDEFGSLPPAGEDFRIHTQDELYELLEIPRLPD